jgi:hypothetical protein
MVASAAACSIIIPIGLSHEAVAQVAIASAHAQTVPVEVLPILDTDRRGPGWGRNRGLEMATAPFVLFLDADDFIEPDTVAQLARHYRPGHYVYCDDWQGDHRHSTPDRAVWLDGSWHAVTTLIRTPHARAIGGFDEALPGIEDLEFYLKLQASGVCGVRCPAALLHYTDQGERSKQFQQSPHFQALKFDIYQRYAMRVNAVCACGEAISVPLSDASRQDGDVMAKASYTPRQVIGPISGRLYPRPQGMHDYYLWIDPRDVVARPEWWTIKTTTTEYAPDVDAVLAMVGAA